MGGGAPDCDACWQQLDDDVDEELLLIGETLVEPRRLVD